MGSLCCYDTVAHMANWTNLDETDKTMMSTLLPTLLTGGIVAIITALITVPAQRRKILAEADHTKLDMYTQLAKTNIELLAPLREELHRVQTELNTAHTKVQQLTQDLDAAHSRERAARRDADSYAARIHLLELELASLREGRGRTYS